MDNNNILNKRCQFNWSSSDVDFKRNSGDIYTVNIDWYIVRTAKTKEQIS